MRRNFRSPRQIRDKLVARAMGRADIRTRMRVRRAASILATSLGVVLITGLVAAITTFGGALAPSGGNQALAMGLLASALLISSGIVVAFWRHLVENLDAGAGPRRNAGRRRSGAAVRA